MQIVVGGPASEWPASESGEPPTHPTWFADPVSPHEGGSGRVPGSVDNFPRTGIRSVPGWSEGSGLLPLCCTWILLP